MDDILYGTFFLAQFGVPIAALVFIVYCIVKGEISKGYLKAAGFFDRIAAAEASLHLFLPNIVNQIRRECNADFPSRRRKKERGNTWEKFMRSTAATPTP